VSLGDEIIFQSGRRRGPPADVWMHINFRLQKEGRTLAKRVQEKKHSSKMAEAVLRGNDRTFRNPGGITNRGIPTFDL